MHAGQHSTARPQPHIKTPATLPPWNPPHHTTPHHPAPRSPNTPTTVAATAAADAVQLLPPPMALPPAPPCWKACSSQLSWFCGFHRPPHRPPMDTTASSARGDAGGRASRLAHKASSGAAQRGRRSSSSWPGQRAATAWGSHGHLDRSCAAHARCKANPIRTILLKYCPHLSCRAGGQTMMNQRRRA